MPNYTENYNLKKPLANENYNVEDQNGNMDIIDQKIKEVADSVGNIEIPVTSVNNKTGDIELTAIDVGAETPAGAQAKANAAEQNAKNYADSIKPTKLSQLENDVGYITTQRPVSSSVSSTSTSTAANSYAVKTAYDKAVSAYNLAATKETAFSKNSGFNLPKSDSVSSSSSNTLATSKAVKTAYDKANSAYEKVTSHVYGYEEFSITIGDSDDITKYIPIGSGKTRGIMIIADYTDDDTLGGLFFFSTDKTKTYGIGYSEQNSNYDGSVGVISRQYTSVISKIYGGFLGGYDGPFDRLAALKDVYIEGSNIVLELYCQSQYSSGEIFGFTVCWEVW